MLPFRFRHRINPKLKHTYLSIESDGTVLVKSKGLSSGEVEMLLVRKSAWIIKALKAMAEKKGKINDPHSQKELYWFGRPYPLRTLRIDSKRTELSMQEGVFTLYAHTSDREVLLQAIHRYYKASLQKKLFGLIGEYAEEMSLEPSGVAIRKTKRQWGSCSGANRLSFSSALAKVPIEAIEYVVVHELAHIRHKHHRKPFWDEVERVLPDYRRRQEILREYSLE